MSKAQKRSPSIAQFREGFRYGPADRPQSVRLGGAGSGSFPAQAVGPPHPGFRAAIPLTRVGQSIFSIRGGLGFDPGPRGSGEARRGAGTLKEAGYHLSSPWGSLQAVAARLGRPPKNTRPAYLGCAASQLLFHAGDRR